MSDRVSSSWWEWLKLAVPLVLLAVGAFWLTWRFVRPAPPDRVVIATGSQTGVYYRVAQEYAGVFADAGIELEIRTTEGSAENYALLGDADSGVDAAIVQGGTLPPPPNAGEPKTAELEAVASIYLEPLWLFYRGELWDKDVTELTDLRNTRVAIGTEGSGTRALAELLTRANGLGPGVAASTTRLETIGGGYAADQLLHGEIDALFMVISPNAPLVAKLLADPNIRVASFRRADAYTRRFRFLQRVTLPEGAVDLARNLPRHDVDMVAAAAAIVVRSDTHPAVVQLLVDAARRTHKDGDLLSEPGDFPSALRTELPVGDEALYHLNNPPNVLHRNLPFWLASLVDRLIILIIPLLVVLVPLVRIAPPVYRWRIRSRIYKWYARLRRFDEHLQEGVTTDEAARQLARLRELEREVAGVKVPLSYMEEFYNLRLHMGYMRSRLEAKAGESGDKPVSADAGR